MARQLTAKSLVIRVLAGLAVLLAVMAVCSAIGTETLSLKRILAGPGSFPGENIDYEIYVGVRLPRITIAAIVGAALAGSGVVLQAILRNPLAEPYLMGISSGAGLGAILAVISGITFSFWGGSPIAACAFVGAISTVWLVWVIGHWTARSEITTLLLAGVVVNAFFSAVTMFLTSVAKSDQLQSTIFWLMGNIREVNLTTIWADAVIIVAGLFALMGISMQLNVLSFGEQQAQTLGVSTGRVKFIGFGVSAIITAVAVSLSGLIGFVGLIVPHAIRLVIGPDHRQLLPLSALAGAAFVVTADTFARTIVAPAELPVGVITAITGGPFFLMLLARYTKRVGWMVR
jgi:iron complex transport system permease protein